jgi:hypothetical protein
MTSPPSLTPDYDPAQDYLAEEFQQIYVSRIANPETLGDRPLIVLAPTRPDRPPPGTSDDLWNELRLEKGDQAMGLVLLSRNSKLVRDPSSSHNIQLDNPQLVARVIAEVVEAAVKGTKLDPSVPRLHLSPERRKGDRERATAIWLPTSFPTVAELVERHLATCRE